MSGYQVTGWLAWQHHMALVMMSSLYILTLKLENQDEMPLLNARDARLLVIAKAFATQKEVDLCLEHIRIRHRHRQADIDSIISQIHFSSKVEIKTKRLKKT